MVKLPIDYRILNALQEPLTVKQVSDKLNIDTVIAKAYCNGLKIKGKAEVSYMKPDDNGRPVDVYKSLVDTIYGVCNKCEGVLDVNKLVNGICVNCLNIDEMNYADLGTSLTQIQHMQSIINDQKRIINQLQQELYIMKKNYGNTV